MGVLINYISQVVQFFYNWTVSLGIANYGIAIIFFTLIIKLVLFPLTSQQVKSMLRMQDLQPKLQEIQKKYKGNPQKSQQAMMELYKKSGVNPMAGCLPLLLQMPILYGLFAALREFFDPQKHPPYVNLDHARFFWIDNLGEPDLYILPVLAVVATFLQQRVVMPTGGDQSQPMVQSQKMMLYIMPLFMGWISRSFPAALALYWVCYSAFSAVEQVWLRRRTGRLKEEVAVSEKH